MFIDARCFVKTILVNFIKSKCTSTISLCSIISYMLCYHGSNKTWLCINVSLCVMHVMFRHVLRVYRYFVSLPYLDRHLNSSSTFMVVGIFVNLC